MKTRILGVLAGIMMVLGMLGVLAWQSASLTNSGVALAQGPSATPTAGNSQQPPADVLAAAESFWKSLASKLGIQESDLKTKAVAAEKELIDQAVKDGKLTQDQATQEKAQLDQNGPAAPMVGGPHRGGRGGPNGQNGPNGQVPQGGRGGQNGQGPQNGQRPGGPGPRAGLDEIEAIAKVLNLKPADLLTQIHSGKTVADLAKTQNVSETTVKQAFIDAAKTRIAREVQDGLLTQAQADAQTANLTLDKVDLTHLFAGPDHLQQPPQQQQQPQQP
ncbi:MAG: hypothetical protein WCF84_13315 [Anaerolineae bacterium]